MKPDNRLKYTEYKGNHYRLDVKKVVREDNQLVYSTAIGQLNGGWYHCLHMFYTRYMLIGLILGWLFVAKDKLTKTLQAKA